MRQDRCSICGNTVLVEVRKAEEPSILCAGPLGCGLLLGAGRPAVAPKSADPGPRPGMHRKYVTA